MLCCGIKQQSKYQRLQQQSILSSLFPVDFEDLKVFRDDSFFTGAFQK